MTSRRKSDYLVTGATGLLGKSVMDLLSEVGASFTGLSSGFVLDQDGDRTPAPWLKLPERVSEFVDELNPRAIFHLAGLLPSGDQSGDIAGMVRSNIEFGVGVACGAAQAGSRLVYPASIWQRPNGSPGSTSLYAATKDAFLSILDFYTSSENLQMQQVFVHQVYGLGDSRGRIVSLLMAAAISGEPITLGSPDKLLNLVLSKDAAQGLLYLADEAPLRRDWVLRGRHSVTLGHLVDLISQVSGRALRIHWDPRLDRKVEMWEDWSFGHAVDLANSTSLEDGLKQVWQSVAHP